MADALGVNPKDVDDGLVDIVVTVVSSSTFLELHERLGHDPDSAARLATWAVEAIVQRAERERAVRTSRGGNT